MKKSELIKIYHENSMEFMRDPITKEGVGIHCRTSMLIPMLDKICDSQEYDNVTGVRHSDFGGYDYFIYCPHRWIDLSGWRSERR